MRPCKRSDVWPFKALNASEVDGQLMHSLMLQLQNTQRQYMAIQGDLAKLLLL